MRALGDSAQVSLRFLPQRFQVPYRSRGKNGVSNGGTDRSRNGCLDQGHNDALMVVTVMISQCGSTIWRLE